MNSAEAEVIVAAGESSKTDTLEFIEKQRQMFNELKSRKLSDPQDKDVVMQDEDRASTAANFDFKDDHFKTTPPNSSVYNGKQIITKQPGLSNDDPKVKCLSQDTAHDQRHADYDNIEEGDYVNISKHKRHGKCETHCSLVYLTILRQGRSEYC